MCPHLRFGNCTVSRDRRGLRGRQKISSVAHPVVATHSGSRIKRKPGTGTNPARPNLETNAVYAAGGALCKSWETPSDPLLSENQLIVQHIPLVHRIVTECGPWPDADHKDEAGSVRQTVWSLVQKAKRSPGISRSMTRWQT